MSKNTFKETPLPPPQKEQVAEKPKPRRSSRSARKFVRLLNVFGIFDRNQIVHLLPFIFFMAVLTMFYIANSYYTEKMVREMNKLKDDLKEKRAEFISTSSELMFRTKQSEVAREIQPMEIKESVEPQKKIVISQQKKK